MDSHQGPTKEYGGAQHSSFSGDQTIGKGSAQDSNSSTARVSVKDRLSHFTWGWFLVTMSTGGLATLLGAQPHAFRGLRTIGKIVFIWDLFLFVLIVSTISFRFLSQRERLLKSLRNPTEGLLAPTVLLSVATIITGIQDYGGPSSGSWLATVAKVLFWIYAFCAMLLAVCQYLYLFTAKRLTIQSMTPGWLLPIFPAMLLGTIAGVVAPHQTDDSRMAMLVAGTAFQGLGFWAAMPLFGVFIGRLMQYGLPAPNLRPGMFIAVGPPSFTGLAVITMSDAIPENYEYFAAHPTAAEALKQIALVFAIFIWLLGFWFFCIAALSCLMAIPSLSFHLVWYAFVFPNVGFTLATIQIGRGLSSQGILWVGSAMTILIVVMYLFVVSMHVKAVVKGEILWPGKDEDKDE